MNWEQSWRQILGLSDSVPQFVVASVVLLLNYLLVIIPIYVFISYFNRKLGADFQARVGPNRAGPNGILQPFADTLKLLQKDPLEDTSWTESLWFAVHSMALYSTVAVIPLGTLALMVDTDMSAFLPFWAALVLTLGMMLLGLSQKSVSGWFGGIRVAAQALAGSFPALVALLCAGIRAGGFKWSQLVNCQGSAPWEWTAFSNPFQFLAFFVFMVGGLLLLGADPFDGGTSLQDIRGGIAAHLSGRRLILFRLSKFYGVFLWCVISSAIFLGGWLLPFGIAEGLKGDGSLTALYLIEQALILIKALVLMMAIVWVSRVNPRSRVDQVTDFSWKVLSPLSLFALIGVSVLAAWRELL